MQLVLLFFRGPWWITLGLAAGLVWLGFTVQSDDAARLAARTALLAGDPPATVPVGEMTGAAGRDPVEVSVSAQLVTDHTTRLVEKRNFVTTDETMFYVLAAPDADTGTLVAQAGILIDPDEVDAFAAWVAERLTGFGALGPVVTFDGLKASRSEASHAAKAMREQGVDKADGFYFIDPFLDGREAGLTTLRAGTQQMPWVIWGLAALFALIALAKARGRQLVRPAAGAAPDPVAARLSAPVPQAVSPVPRKPMSMMQKGILAGLALLAVSAAAGRWEIFGMLPVLVVAGFYFLVYRGTRMFGQAARTVAVRLPGLAAPAAVKAPVAPAVVPAPVPAPAVPAAPVAAPAAIAAGKATVRDRFADGPVQPGGFSLSRLMPKRRAGPAAPDSYDRLSAMVAAERRREASRHIRTAE